MIAAPHPDGPVVWRGDGDAWHALVLVHGAVQVAGGAPVRDGARRALRRLLAQGELAGIRLPSLASSRSAPGATGVSASHGPTLSVAAWCRRGAIGVDLVELAVLDTMTAGDLRDTAALYLGETACRRIEAAAGLGQARRLFARHWARREAWLKCAGLSLDEGPRQPAPGRDVQFTTIEVPGVDAAASAVLAIAHRPGLVPARQSPGSHPPATMPC